MVRTRSLALPIAGTLAAIIGCGLLVWFLALRSSARDAGVVRDLTLRADAASAVASLQPILPSVAPGDWTPVAVALDRVAHPDVLLQVFVQGTDTQRRWRVIAAAPALPDAVLPLGDPLVQRAIDGSDTIFSWFDPSGTAWCSLVMPIRASDGRTLALVESRLQQQARPASGLFIAGAVFLLVSVLACVWVWLALRTARLSVHRLSAGLIGVARGDARADDGLHPQEFGPLAGSLQVIADEGSTRRLRQRQELADLRIQAARFQGADRAKTSLLVALCRTLRQSVETLRSSSSLLSQTRLDRTQREYLDSLHAGCGDLIIRIGDVLDFALLEAECLSLDQRPLRPRNVLEEAVSIVSERCAQLPLEIAWIADPEVPERVIGDVARVRQVLVNLIGLAANTAEEGTILIRLGNAEQDQLRFAISLVGVTLTAERMRLLLEGAISSDSSSDRLQGQGLGLVLGKRLAQAMGGSLTIERDSEEGVQLLCMLRFAVDDVSIDATLARKAVMIAHERPATRAMLASIVRRAGATVTEVGSRAELRSGLSSTSGTHAVVASTRLVALDLPDDAAAVIGGLQELLGAIPVVLVVDPIHRSQAGNLRSAGAFCLLSPPVRQQVLLAGIADAVSGIKRDSGVNHAPIDPSVTQRVLIVEDNQVNQLVLVRMLESMGIAPELAGDGVEAVERVRAAQAERPYALIFMDCMMPRMDGLEATRVIRSEEEGDQRVYIIAVTANALANDRSKCLAVGMDDYLPKPVTPLALHEALGRWRESIGMIRRGSGRATKVVSAIASLPSMAVPSAPLTSAVDATAPGPAPRPACQAAESATAPPSVLASRVDFTGLRTLSRLAGRSAMQEVVTCFLGEIDDMRSGIREAMHARDMIRLRHAAHKLKGSCGTVGLRLVQSDALEIERIAKHEEHELLEQAAVNLERNLDESLKLLLAFSAEA